MIATRIADAFPAELRNLARWVPWSYFINPKGKRTKRPHYSTKQPVLWRTFADCSADGDGIGFVFTGRVQVAGGTLFAFDLDNCRHPDGRLSPWAVEFIERLGATFCEVTPSGTGVRPWVIVRNAPAGFSKTKVAIDAEGVPGCDKAVEFQVFGYGAPQFTTCTGDTLPGFDQLGVVADLSFLIDHRITCTDPRAAPVSSADAPAVEAIVAQLRSSPFASLIFDADWESAAGGRNDQSASGAFFIVAQAVMREAGGNVEAALAFIQTETAWGRGDVAESADPARYGRPSWLRAELNRAAAKGNAPADVVSVYDDGFDFDAWVAPDAPPLPAEAAAPVEAPPRPPAEVRIVSFAELANRPRPRDLWARMFPERAFGVWYGAPKSGKSYLGLGFAVALAQGLPFLGRATRRAKVLYVPGENVAGMPDKFAAAIGPQRANDPDDPIHEWVRLTDGMPNVTAPDFADALRRELDRLEFVPELIVPDTFARVAAKAGKNENDTADMGAIVDALEGIRDRFNAAVLTIHHANKGGEMRGNSALRGAVDLVAAIARSDSKRLVSTFRVEDMRDGEPPLDPFEIQWGRRHVRDDEHGPVMRFYVESFTDQPKTCDGDAVVEFFRANPTAKQKDCAAALGRSPALISARVKELVRLGELVKVGRLIQVPEAS